MANYLVNKVRYIHQGKLPKRKIAEKENFTLCAMHKQRKDALSQQPFVSRGPCLLLFETIVWALARLQLNLEKYNSKLNRATETAWAPAQKKHPLRRQKV